MPAVRGQGAVKGRTMNADIALLATVETKADETGYLRRAIEAQGCTVEVIDVSLGSGGRVWSGADKLSAMDAVGARVGATLDAAAGGRLRAVVGLGGGTGSEIVLRALTALPPHFPKMLITTMPFDPRAAVADNSIVLLPTLADICGLNATLRRVLTTGAAMIAGLCRSHAVRQPSGDAPSIGITALGATAGAIDHLTGRLRARGREYTVFHANGFGGAAYARFAQAGAFGAVVDLTVHEITRWMFAGAHAPMPHRFTAAARLPQIILPGGLNFIGLGESRAVPRRYLGRPHYRHSGYFTHVKLTAEEMERAAAALADQVARATGPVRVIVPMGGFSHEDRPGGAIEDRRLREIAREALAARLPVDVLPHHICDPRTAEAIVAALTPHLQDEPAHV